MSQPAINHQGEQSTSSSHQHHRSSFMIVIIFFALIASLASPTARYQEELLSY
jgi:hypothetical protein